MLIVFPVINLRELPSFASINFAPDSHDVVRQDSLSQAGPNIWVAVDELFPSLLSDKLTVALSDCVVNEV